MSIIKDKNIENTNDDIFENKNIENTNDQDKNIENTNDDIFIIHCCLSDITYTLSLFIIYI